VISSARPLTHVHSTAGSRPSQSVLALGATVSEAVLFSSVRFVDRRTGEYRARRQSDLPSCCPNLTLAAVVVSIGGYFPSYLIGNTYNRSPTENSSLYSFFSSP
jgi:hypothetical protein